jgi:serine O-acetyltransferase
MNTLTFRSYPITLSRKRKTFSKLLFKALFSEENTQEKALKRAQKIIEEFAETFGNEAQIRNAYEALVNALPQIRTQLDQDAKAFERNDPAVTSLTEVYIAYPGFYAIALYRVAHFLHQKGVALLPRLIAEHAHSETGIDIHPGALIGHSFFIDHGTGVVIGETSLIGNNVSIYQGVTLGGIKVSKELASTKRHPTIEDDVTLYANATILGGNVVIGANSTVGANVCVTISVPANSLVTQKSEISIKPKQ